MPRSDVFRERSDQGNRPVKTLVAAPPQIVLCLGLVSVSKSQLSEVVIDFSQPTRMRGFVSVFNAPGQLILRCLLLMENAWKFGMDDAGNPIHYEDLPSRKLLGSIEDGDRVTHVTDPVQQRDGRCVLSPQQPDGA